MKPFLFDIQEREPNRSRSGGQTWFFQSADNLNIQYSEIWNPEPALHAHEAEQINIVLGGIGMFQCGDELFELAKGCLIRIPPQVPHGLHHIVGNEPFKVIQLIAPKQENPAPESKRIDDKGHTNWDKGITG